MRRRHISVRLTEEQIVRVDDLIPQLSGQYKAVTRSDVLRVLVEDALPRFEKKPDQKPGEADQKPEDK